MTDPKATETDDTEGHGFHGIVKPEGETDDTEGNNFRSGAPATVETDDTGGNPRHK